MSINILPTFAVQQYSQNLQLLLQQKASKLRAAVTSGSYRGKQASPVDQMGKIEMQPVVSRFAPMGRVDATTDRRWVFPSDFDLPQLIDNFDLLRTINDPKSVYVQNAVFAANRQIDKLIATAFFATAKVGEQGTTDKAFGTTLIASGGYNVSVSEGAATSGMNVDKLKTARQALLENNVDLDAETPLIAITAKQERNLLDELEVINLDYNDRPVLVKGKIDTFLGFQFLHYQGLSTGTDDVAGTSRMIPVWVPSGMHAGIWLDPTVDVSQRKDLQGMPWQVYLAMTLGATRIEEGKVLRIWCRE